MQAEIRSFARQLGYEASDTGNLKRSDLKKVLKSLRQEYQEKSATLERYAREISEMSLILETPAPHVNTADLSQANLDNVDKIRGQMSHLQSERCKEKYAACYNELLKACKMLEIGQSFEHSKDPTIEDLRILLSLLEPLRKKVPHATRIHDLIYERYKLIQHMKDFELSARDPERLKGNSIRLLQEERFRKTALPTLLKMERELEKQLLDYETSFRETFMYKGQPYMEVLRSEICGRYLNETVFGFERTPAKAGKFLSE